MSNIVNNSGQFERPSRSIHRTKIKDQIKSRDSSNCGSNQGEKKLPPIKAPVGLAKGPDLINVKSKIGSLVNVNHKPAQVEKKVLNLKLGWKAQSRIGSLENAKHKPGGGGVKVESKKLEWNVTSRIGSLDNVKHKPGGGLVKIFDEKYARSASEVRYSKTNGRTIGRTNGRTNGRCVSPHSTNPSTKSGSNTPISEKMPSFSVFNSNQNASKSSDLEKDLREKLKISNLEEKEVDAIIENERSKLSSKRQPMVSKV